MRFIFVHGGFHAAWCWDHTIAELRDLGHDGDDLGGNFDADVGEMLGYLKFDDEGAMTFADFEGAWKYFYRRLARWFRAEKSATTAFVTAVQCRRRC